MRIRQTFTLFLLFCFLNVSNAQDLHFTYFQMSPLTLNPAMTGAFLGTFRAGAHFRGQWLDVNGYKTPVIFIDSPIMRGLREKDWVGVGISFYRDQAGTGGLVTSGAHLSFAYHFGLGEDATTVLSLGGQYGSISRSIGDVESLMFRDEILGTGGQSLDKTELRNMFGPDNMSDKSDSDWNAGISINSQLNEDANFRIGVSVGHLTTPNISLLSGNDENKMRITAFSQLTQVVSDRLRFQPAVLYQTKGQSNEFELHGVMGYLFNAEKGIILNGGVGYRVSGSAQLLLGADIKDLKIGAAFDINTSGLQSAPGFQNAFEIGLSYIFKIYKDPDVEPVIFCPRF